MKTRRRGTPLLILMLVGGLGAAAGRAATELPAERQREILNAAIAAYDRAAEAAVVDPHAARQSYQEAATQFEALRAAGVENAALEYDLGNTYFRLQHLGQALVHYRRAEALAPDDPRIAANLRYARGQVEPQLKPAVETRLMRQLLFWHYDTPLNYRVRATYVLSALAWVLLFIWLRVRRPALLVAGVFALVLAWAAGGSAVFELRDLQARPPAVVTGDSVTLRLARGAGADPALNAPLGPGVEVRILEARGDWLRVQLPSDQTGWLPAAAVTRVF